MKNRFKVPNCDQLPYFVIGGIGQVLALITYYYCGFDFFIFFLWFCCLFCLIRYFYHKRNRAIYAKASSSLDFYVILGLYILFIPVYLLFIDIFPYQINTDEIAVTMAADWEKNSPDLFGLSDYFGFPSLNFFVLGWVAQFWGGIHLVNMRLAHAFFALTIIIPAYIFFRSYWPRFYAAAATVVLLSNHSLMAIGRMANRSTPVILNELAAFILLFLGLRRSCAFYSFVGGVVAGLSFYHYFPGRLIFFIWLFYLTILALFFRNEFPFTTLTKHFLVSALGFSIVITPMAVATIKRPEFSLTYPRKQLLVFPEGRELQRSWYFYPNVALGVKQNIINGITLFNNNISDRAYIYPNEKSGFVDPLTGILLWVGLLFFIFKYKKNEYDLFAVMGFLFVWTIFIFFVNLTPNYTRLFIILPFVAILATAGLKFLAEAISRLEYINKTIFCCGIVVIVCWNGIIFDRFLKKGYEIGDPIRGTLRYIEARKADTSHTFYLVYSGTLPHLSNEWETLFSFVAGSGDRVEILFPKGFVDEIYNKQRPVFPEEFLQNQPAKPFTIFMDWETWLKSKEILIEKFPNMKLHLMQKNYYLVAVEIQ